MNIMLSRLIFAALMAFALGIQTSVSVPALLHILGAVPALYFTYKNLTNWRSFPLSLWAVLSFVTVILLSSIVNISTMQEIGKSIGGIKYLLFAFCFTFALHAYMKEDRTRQLRWFTSTLAATVILAAIYGIIRSELGFSIAQWKYTYFNPRTGGFYGYMRYAYNVQYLIVAFAALLLIKEFFNPYYHRGLVIFALIFGCIGLFFSETRGAVLATAAGIVALVFQWNRQWGKKLAIVGGICFAVLLSFVLLKTPEKLEESASYGSSSFRMLESYQSRSNTLRVSQFQSALKAFGEKPLFGHGPGQLRFHVKRIKEQYDLSHKEYVNQHAHNLFLEIMANLGVAGLITFVAWLFLWGLELWRTQGPFSRYIALPALVVTVVSGQVEYVFSATGLFTVMLIYSASMAEIYSTKNKA